MANILAVGNATLDIVNIVDHYPDEDEELRATTQYVRRGGNAANTVVALSQLGHRCTWAGTLAEEPDARLIREDLARHGVDLGAVLTLGHGKVPTSYVTLNRANGSRTIVHYRDLPEYTLHRFSALDLAPYQWLHFEGRNLRETRRMFEYARSTRPQIRISLEVEKPRPGIEELLGLADLLLFSRDYARHHGFHDPEEFLRATRQRVGAKAMTCTWGAAGAFALGAAGEEFRAPAFPPAAVVDTLGAGDVFNAGLIDQLLRGHDLEIALIEASRLAGKKCGLHGLDRLAE